MPPRALIPLVQRHSSNLQKTAQQLAYARPVPDRSSFSDSWTARTPFFFRLLTGEPPPFLLQLASASTSTLNTKGHRCRSANVCRYLIHYYLSCLTEPSRTGKEVKERKYGKAFVGGPFSLIEAKSGKPFTQDNLVGQWNLVYFGFTNCPDVCPEELDKMTVVVNEIGVFLPLFFAFPKQFEEHETFRSSEKNYGDKVQPIFISCDPARDTDEALRKYLAGG